MASQPSEMQAVAWSGWWRSRQARPMPTATSAYVLLAVVLLFPMSLKVIKAVHATEGQLVAADLLRVLSADIALGCFSFGVALGLGRLARKVRHGALIFGVGTTLYLAFLLGLSALEHQAWARSSTLVDWNMLWYAFEHYQELRSVFAAETTVGGVLLLVAAGLCAVAPVLADLIATRSAGVELRCSPRRASVTVCSAVPFLWFAAGDPGAPELYPIKQSAVVGLLAGAFSAAERAAEGAGDFKPPDAGRTQQRIAQALKAAQLSQTTQGRPKNVLLLVLESTRFDATSAYVPRLKTTPELRKLAEQGVRVDRAFVDMPHTSKALTSVLCGYSPRLSSQVSEAEPGGLPRPCLAHALGELGYQRAFFQAATGTYEGRHQFAVNAGFEEIFARESYDESGFEEINYLAVEDKVMVQPIMRWVDAQKDKPFLLAVLTCISHHSYGLPTNFVQREYPRQPAQLGGRLPRPWSDYNRYLNTVAYADEFLGALLDGLRKRGQLDDTLVVVVGDHGQAFFEHGQKAHNTVIWEEGLRVPLVLHNSKLFPTPVVVDGVRRQVDIAPTVLTQLGVRFPPDLFEGRDLLSKEEHQHAYSSCWYDDRCMAETTGTMRVVDHFDIQPTEVFDLLADPFERRNLRLVGSAEERGRFDAMASEARTRMRAVRSEIEQRYMRGEDAKQQWLLSKAPAPSHRLRARLEDSIELLGYDTQTHDVVPDQFWEAVVYFKCLTPSAEGWRLFGMLETSDGRSTQDDHHPANGHFYLHQCKAGQIVADHIRVWIPGDYPPGELRYWWGSVLLRDLGHVTRENRRLGRRDITPLERGLLVRDQSLLMAKLNVKGEYRPELATLLASAVLTTAPALEKPLNVQFGDNLVLLDARVEPLEVRRHGSVTVTTVWRVDGEQSGPWQLAVHVDSDQPGYWLREAHAPVDGIHPIANWEPGTFVIDRHTVQVPDYMPQGNAKVWVGIRTSSRRMHVTEAGSAEVLDRRVRAGSIYVKP